MYIDALGTYTNTGNLYKQLVASSANQVERTSTLSQGKSSTQSSLSRQLLSSGTNSSSQSLTEQLSGLVRLVRYAMDSMGLTEDSRVTFSKLQDYCDQVNERLNSAVQDGLSQARVDPTNLTFTLTEDGDIRAHSSSTFNQALANLALLEHPGQGALIQEMLARAGSTPTYPVSFSIDASGTPTALDSSQQAFFDEHEISFSDLAATLAEERIDPTLDFTIAIDDTDAVSVTAADKKYDAVLNAFFAENPSIVADYKRTEALSGIETARKFLALSPSERRTRLQIESIAAWWDTSGNTSSASWFSSYTNGAFARLRGVNMQV